MIRRRPRSLPLLLAAAAVLATAVPAGAISLPDRTFRVSDTPDAFAGGGSSARPSIDPRGRLVAFDSSATDLAQDPNGPVRDVFLRDLRTDETQLVSAPVGGAGADGPSDSPVIGAGGGLVAFTSLATNLIEADTNGQRDVFVREGLEAPRRVSVPATGRALEADGPSFAPDVSRDGRTVVFTSAASNLVDDDTNGKLDVFARNLDTGAVRRVSEPGRGGGDGDSGNPAISPDGRYVSFTSAATNLVARDTNRIPDVFVADLRNGRVSRVTLSSRGRQQDRSVIAPFSQVSDISSGGRYVVFDSDAENLVRFDRNEDTDVFIRDRRKRSTKRVSISTTFVEGTNDSFNPTITASGRFVAFESFADEIAPGDAPREDVFVRDVSRRTTVVANVTSQGARPRGPELVRQLLQRPTLADDASAVAFTSTASNLVGDDANSEEDVFVRIMVPPRGGFARAPAPSSPARRASFRLRADDPAADLFLCVIDGLRRICGLRSRTPRLAPGVHVLRVIAGGPGMLYSTRSSRRRFRVLP